jgi:predicted nucleic acid-binding protein
LRNQHRRPCAQTPLLDTNILLYSISRDPTATTKHDRAVALIDAGNNALSVQVLQEFYVQATRPTRPDPLPHDIAAWLIRTWLRFKVQEISVSIMTGALEIIRRAEHTASATKLTRVNDQAIRRVLEAAGVEFIDANGGGPGVRLRGRSTAGQQS